MAADPVAASVSRKLDLIESGKAKPGSVFRFTPSELNAWVRVKAPGVVTDGFRQPQLVLGNGEASRCPDRFPQGAACQRNRDQLAGRSADSRRKAGEGESQHSIGTRPRDGACGAGGNRRSGGHGSSRSIFWCRISFVPFYPEAKIDEPFDLAGNVDRIEVTPAEARVYIRR